MYTEEKSFDGLKYVIRYPNNYNISKKYPVLFSMHGAGTRGMDVYKLYENPFFTITDDYSNLPFITVAPLCHLNTWFDLFETLLKLINHIYNSKFTDKNRFYAMGASVGGYAVWQMAMSCPEVFSWLLDNIKKETDMNSDMFNSSQIYG